MSATTIAADIVSNLGELNRDMPVNREPFLRNTRIAFQKHVEIQTVEKITEEIRP